MSDQAWAIEKMMKHNLVVHFNAGVVSGLIDEGIGTYFVHEHFEVGNSIDFYKALQKIVLSIEGEKT